MALTEKSWKNNLDPSFWDTPRLKDHGITQLWNRDGKWFKLYQTLLFKICIFSKEKDPSSIVQEQTWQTIREAQKVTATDPSGFLHGFCRVCNECSWLHQHTMTILTSTPGLSNGTYRIANTRPGNGGFSGHMVCHQCVTCTWDF